jgi:hypothetical protein
MFFKFLFIQKKLQYWIVLQEFCLNSADDRINSKKPSLYIIIPAIIFIEN